MSYRIINKFGAIIGDNIVGRDTSKVFGADTRRSVDFPDLADVQNKVRDDEPYMNLLAAKQEFDQDYAYIDYSDVIEISDITHAGSSTANYQITGDHIGNNDYVLEITQSGLPGAAMYKLSVDGGQTFDAPRLIPASGQISVDDGTTFIFSEGSLVAGDQYSWSTTSMRYERYRTDSFVINLVVHIHTKVKAELVGDEYFTGYIDQLQELFSKERGFHLGGDVIYSVKLDKGGQVQIGEREGLHHGALALVIEGCLYTTREIPLIGSVTAEVLE